MSPLQGGSLKQVPNILIIAGRTHTARLLFSSVIGGTWPQAYPFACTVSFSTGYNHILIIDLSSLPLLSCERFLFTELLKLSAK